MKKIIVYVLGFCLMVVVDLACCGPCEIRDLKYSKYTGFATSIFSGNNELMANAVTNSDSLILKSRGITECLAKNKNPFSFFNKAQAFQCNCHCGDYGLKKPLTNIIITADQPFNGTLSGMPINSGVFFKHRVKYDDRIVLLNAQQISDTIIAYQLSKNFDYNNFEFVAVKPVGGFSGNFKITFIENQTDTAGTKFFPTITWL